MRVERLDLSEWGDALPNSGVEVFHTPEALSVLDEHATGDLRLYGGFKGQQPVGLFPLLVQDRSIGSAVLSPPPGFGVPRMGPMVMPTSPKQRKREKVNTAFIEAVLEDVGVDDSLTLFRSICSPDYDDPRPFSWSELGVATKFTYVLDLANESTDDVLTSFSKSLRREIRDGEELDIEITREGLDGARSVYEDTKVRYQEQDKTFPLSWEYVRDLVDAVDERSRVYVARTSDGRFLSGITVLYSDDAAFFWQGGTRATHENVSINSLLHWRVIEDVIEDPPMASVTSYDLMGANTERLCRYKSKFGADLVPYYVAESQGTGMDVAKRAYRMVSR
ncbi:Acetyltransferase (GNAT) domain-containing protein [Natronoarchaeum philippinense]|uniref:Acetyltransferase (GNAT) domain-containing protein n=1 Tax=Natronoarchaeum philippinense TaxID=558529 RepID=A0A285P6A1_NATPI|nr:GNAT family N-acetyltransferase [Natronoarchaeum philippinense]SNZ16978.1 Acetyltransferase (GNAT) domain-containing protein [Natronoarchaeum philippinense]